MSSDEGLEEVSDDDENEDDNVGDDVDNSNEFEEVNASCGLHSLPKLSRHRKSDLLATELEGNP